MSPRGILISVCCMKRCSSDSGSRRKRWTWGSGPAAITLSQSACPLPSSRKPTSWPYEEYRNVCQTTSPPQLISNGLKQRANRFCTKSNTKHTAIFPPYDHFPMVCSGRVRISGECLDPNQLSSADLFKHRTYVKISNPLMDTRTHFLRFLMPHRSVSALYISKRESAPPFYQIRETPTLQQPPVAAAQSHIISSHPSDPYFSKNQLDPHHHVQDASCHARSWY